MKSFLELTQLLFDRQLLAEETTVKSVLKKYQLAMEHGEQYVGIVKKKSFETETNTKVFKGSDGQKIGILPVKGMLVYEETGWEALCGMTSYEGLQAKADKMINELEAEHIILEVNSGGGMAYGCFETAQEVRRMADSKGVKITAYVDGVAYSGGYAWCCIADEVISNPMGGVGSIGVVLPLVNTSERDKKEGIERVWVTAGKSKVPYDKDGKYTKEALDDIQDGVMDTYTMFVDHVSQMRGLSTEAVENTEAKTFRTKDALKLGLIDQVMTKEQFYQHLGNFNGDASMSIQVKDSGAKVENEQSPVMVALTDQIKTLKDENKGLADQISKFEASAKSDGEALVTANAKVTELEKQLATLTAEAEATKLSARKDKISALVSVDTVDEHMDFVSDFTDEKFNKYISNLEKSNEMIEKSFKPVGDDDDEAGKQDEAVSVETSLSNRIKQRQGKAV